jgi:hypothetical protein
MILMCPCIIDFIGGEWITRVSGGEGALDTPGPLKVPKREIFNRSDFPDFYTMKSLRVGDFGVKI